MKKVCVLLNGDVKNDGRVIKTIRTLSSFCLVDLFYIAKEQGPETNYFNSNVRLFNHRQKENLWLKIIRHSCFFNEFNFYKKTVLSKNLNYDYIYANDLPCLKPSIQIKKAIGAKVVYDAHEIYNETLNQFFPEKAFFLKKAIFVLLLNLMRFLGKKAERKYIRQADEIITVGKFLKEYFERTYRVSNIHVMMNCPLAQSPEKTVDIKKLFGFPADSKLFLYQGYLNRGRGLHLLIQAFKKVEDNCFLVVLGEGVIKKDLENLTEKLQLQDKIKFAGMVPHEELMSWTWGADYGINLLESTNLSKKYAVPNKLFEYIHSQKPVISSIAPETTWIYDKYPIGLLVENNIESLSKAINQISQKEVSSYRHQCILAADEFNWSSQEKVLLRVIH